MTTTPELGAPGTAPVYEPITVSDAVTVVSTYDATDSQPGDYQSEAELEAAFIEQLTKQAYQRLVITSAKQLEENLRAQLEKLNNVQFTDTEWSDFFSNCIASTTEGVVEKTVRIQQDHIVAFQREDGSLKNIKLIDKQNIHNNAVQVINQYVTKTDKRTTRLDVTILVNGLPLVHVELKRRGVALRQAFNQIDRYQRDAFWADSGLFQYVQLFVISNGTHTKYYSNTTRERKVQEASGTKRVQQSSNTYEFTSWWAAADNKPIKELTAFTKTFFAKHTLLNILTKYCVLDESKTLLVMRPYQIAAAEKIMQRIISSANYGKQGTTEAGGYIWHTTGSGKTLTSFKTAQLARDLPVVDKVLFVVDRKDLDYQTIKEYERFEKGCVTGTKDTSALTRSLNNPETKIIVTTIQKLDRFIKANKNHTIYKGRLVVIFDECHRSQFGDMGTAIRKTFKNSHLFGFTGTPIFTDNAASKSGVKYTTQHLFGDQLHAYTIIDAINDKNVLPFKVSYHATIQYVENQHQEKVPGINTDEPIDHPERIQKVVEYILDNFDVKTKRNQAYHAGEKTLKGFNSMFAVSSIAALRLYYDEFDRQQKARALANSKYKPLTVATIFSYAANEEAGGILDDEEMETRHLDASSRDFLDRAIAEYNTTFKTNFDTSGTGFENYYKDLSQKVKQKQVDIVLVVNMFLTGFDATTLNTLWVDKNLRQHGLVQAFSRTNRILNSVKTYGNIVCFRNLEKNVDEALALFGNKEARGVALIKPYGDYYTKYCELAATLIEQTPQGTEPLGETAEKEFVDTFSEILRLRNVLTAFDEFTGDTTLSDRQLQDYQSIYLGIHDAYKRGHQADKVSILDDVVFEIELIKQVEVNIDYILALVAKWKNKQTTGKQLEAEVQKAVDSSPTLRSKRDLILAFVNRVSSVEPEQKWDEYVNAAYQTELNALIAAENLKDEQARKFMENAFSDGTLNTYGTAVTKLLPAESRFQKTGTHTERKLRVIAALRELFERYSGVV